MFSGNKTYRTYKTYMSYYCEGETRRKIRRIAFLRRLWIILYILLGGMQAGRGFFSVFFGEKDVKKNNNGTFINGLLPAKCGI